MPRKKRQVSMNPSRAIQALRRIKNIQPDELGNLDFILSSETSSVVRCHNHSYTVAMQKQMDIFYRHHVTNMRKLSKSQQIEYRNLMKVKNDKRRMYRSGVMRQREENEFDVRMKIERDRNEAEIKLLNLTLDDDETQGEDEIDLERKEADRSGWLRIRRRDQMTTSDLLPTIYDSDNDRRPDSSILGENGDDDDDDNEGEYTHKDITDNHYGVQNVYSDIKSEGQHANRINSTTFDSDAATNHGFEKNDDSDNVREDLPTCNRSGNASVDVEAEHIQTIDKSNQSYYQDYDDDRQSGQSLFDSQRHESDGQKKSFDLSDSGAKLAKHHKPGGFLAREPNVQKRKTSEVVQKDAGVPREEKYRARRKSVPENDVTKAEGSMVAIHPVTDLISKRNFETKEDEMVKIQELGTSDKHLQKLPSLHLEPIDQVIRYRRQERGRDLIGTVIAVKPSAEIFPMPSKMSEYHRRKALQWHIEQAPALHTKIQQFLSECDAIPRPASSLQTRPVFFFSRHNPLLTRSANHSTTSYQASEITNRRNEVPYDVETITRDGAESVIRGHGVAITKEMVNRKHGVVTPHK